ncbi:MAG: hypothetical protein N3I35_09980 [Clostridia bacterium]|nr:hypothetical protein [Clostridia bacterium]
MGKCEEHFVKIEAGQILNPDHFPPPNELVCIQVPKVFDQVALRSCQTVMDVALPGAVAGSTNVLFRQAYNFNITDITVYSKTDSMTKPGFKKLKLTVTVTFDIDYAYVDSLGVRHEPTLRGYTSVFDITVNEIYCPDCVTQIGLVRYPGGTGAIDEDGNLVKAEALIEVFNTAIAPPTPGVPTATYTLSFDIGAFFIIKCECVVQLLIPAYGYCPIPPEQTISESQRNCSIFSDRCLTPFPPQFFPDQKWNPLDKGKKEDWDD